MTEIHQRITFLNKNERFVNHNKTGPVFDEFLLKPMLWSLFRKAPKSNAFIPIIKALDIFKSKVTKLKNDKSKFNHLSLFRLYK